MIELEAERTALTKQVGGWAIEQGDDQAEWHFVLPGAKSKAREDRVYGKDYFHTGDAAMAYMNQLRESCALNDTCEDEDLCTPALVQHFVKLLLQLGADPTIKMEQGPELDKMLLPSHRHEVRFVTSPSAARQLLVGRASAICTFDELDRATASATTFRLDKWQAVLEAISRLARKSPTTKFSLFRQQGSLLLQHGCYNGAIECFKQAMELNASDHDREEVQRSMSLAQGRYEVQQGAFDKGCG
jgi:tetratricopeptide (TPR) repeat protein